MKQRNHKPDQGVKQNENLGDKDGHENSLSFLCFAENYSMKKQCFLFILLFLIIIYDNAIFQAIVSLVNAILMKSHGDSCLGAGR